MPARIGCWGVKQNTMSTWAWIAVGLASFLLMSVLVGLAVAAILRRIGERVSEPYEAGDWAEAALTRALHQAEEPPEAARPNADQGRVVRLR